MLSDLVITGCLVGQLAFLLIEIFAKDRKNSNKKAISELKDTLKGLAHRHWGQPEMGPCVCEWHTKADRLLKEHQ